MPAIITPVSDIDKKIAVNQQILYYEHILSYKIFFLYRKYKQNKHNCNT